MPDKIKDVYDLISDKGYFADENEFRGFVSDPIKRKEAFELIKDDGYFADENEFNSFFTDVKKKGFTQELPPPPMPSGEKLPQGVGAGVKKPSQSKSTLPSSTTTTTTPKNPQSRIKLYSETATNIQNRIPKLVEAYNQAEQAGDVQAMQELDAQINQDSQKIDYFNKAIEGQNKLAQIEQPNTYANRFANGITTALGQITGGVNFVDNAINQMESDFFESMGISYSDKFKKEFQDFKKSPEYSTLERPSDKIAKAGSIMMKDAAEKSRLMNEQAPYKGGVWDALKDGEIGIATKNASLAFTESFPTSMAMIAAPYLSTAGMAQQSVNEEEGKIGTNDYVAGTLKASFETAFENLFGTGKALKEMVTSLGRDAAIEATTETVKAGMKSLAKKWGATWAEESAGEWATQVASNLVDKANGKKIGTFDGAMDALLIGGFGGLTQGTATVTATHYIDRANLRKAEELKAKAQSLQEQALEAESPVVAEAIEAQAEKINDESDALIEANNEIGQNAPPEVVAAIEDKNDQIDELEVALETATSEVAEVLSAQIEQLGKEAEVLVSEAIKGLELLRQEIPQEEVESVPIEEVENSNKVKGSEPSKSDKSYNEALKANIEVSKENPNASVLIQPKGEDLVLTAVYVGKEDRGKGIGTKVLESVKKQANKIGKKVVLDATNELDSETDLVRLGKFYERNGFVKVGENTYEYDPKNEVSSVGIGARIGIAETNDKEQSNKQPDSNNEEEVVVEKPIVAENTKSANKEVKSIEDKITELRAQEQAEKDATDPNDQEKLDEIYNRYDKLITPLIREQKALETPTSLRDVESTAKVIEDGDKWYKAEKSVKDKDGNDITLTIDKNKDTNHFYIKAKDNKGNEIGSALFETDNGKVWSGNEIEVNEGNRRKGIMSAIYDFAESEGYPLEPTKSLSKEGKAFWENRKSESLLSKEQPITNNKDERSKNQEAVKPKFELEGKKTFFHGSDNKRIGRLKASNAKQFGTGVYFTTNKETASDFGDKISEVELKIENPVYTNTNEWYEIEKEAIKMADEAYGKDNGLKLEEDEDYFRYDPSNLSETSEIPSNFISDAAKKFGYDAIIDKGSVQYENEIVVLDESKIVYPEEQPITNNKNESSKKTNEANREVVLEGVREAGNKNEVGQDSQQLREEEVKPIKSRFDSNIEALVNPETGLSAITSRILDEQQPYKDAFLKRKGLTIEEYRKLNDKEKATIQDDWVKSNDFKELESKSDTITLEEVIEADKVEPKKQVRKKVAAMSNAKTSGKTISEWKKGALELIDKAINTIIENHTDDKGTREMFAKGELDFSYAIDNNTPQVLSDSGIEVNEKGQIVIPTPNGALFIKPSTLFTVRKEINKLSDSNVVSNESTKIKGTAPKKVDAQVAAYEMYEPESVQDAKDELDISNEVLANAKKSGNKKLIELAQLQVDFYQDWYDNFDAKMEAYAKEMARYEASEKAKERLKAIKADKNLAKLYSSSDSIFKEASIYSLEDLYDLLKELDITETPDKATDEIMAYLFAKAAFESRKPTYLTYQTTLKDRIRPIPKLTAKSSWKKQSEARQIERANEELNNLMGLADKYSKEATKIFKEISPSKEEDRFINFLDSLKIRAKGKALGVLPPFAIPILAWNAMLDTVILGIKAGKAIEQAIQDGIDYLKSQKIKFDEAAVRDALENATGVKKEQPKQEGKQKQSGFQQRSIEDATDEVVKNIARENEVYYEVMNQKEEYEKAKKDFGTLEGVIENYSDLNLSGTKDIKLSEAARLQVKRQVAMQTLSIEITKQLAEGKNPTKLNDKVNEIQNALAKDFAKGGQIGAMAIWKFMTPAGIVYQVKEKVKEQNAKIEEILSDEAKAEIAELNDKVVKLQAKLDEEITKTAERKAGKAKPSKGLTEAEKNRKEELKMSLRKKMFGQLNDITNIPKILLDKETIEYARLIIKEGALDFNSFAKEMVKDFGKLVKPILPKLYTKATGEGLLDAESKKQMEEFMQKEFTKAYGTSKIPTKRSVKSDLNKILEGVESGVLNDGFYKQLFLEKFGMKADLTLEETAELHRLAEAVSSLPATSKMYNLAVMAMAQFINSKYPRGFWSDLADTWVALNYAQMLSGVSTHILNIFSTGSGIINSPIRNILNLSKWLNSVKKGIKDKSLQSLWVYNPLYEAIYIPSAWAKGVKVGSDIAMSTMMEGATTDKYVEGLVNMSGKVQISNQEQNRYGVGKRFRPVRLFGVDVNPYNLLKYVGRSLAAEDALMFQTAYEAELAGLALSIYREKGLRGKALYNAVVDAYTQSRVDSGKIAEQVAFETAVLEKAGIKVSERTKRIRASELMVDEVLRTMAATKEQKDDIKKLAASATFTDERNGVISYIARAISGLTNKNRAAQVALKPFIPFTQIVANVTEWMLDSTPIYGLMRANGVGVTGLINKVMKATGSEGIATSQLGEYKSQAYYEQMARAWQGTIALATLFAVFAHGGDEDEDYENSYVQLTGGYEEETRKNKSGRARVTPKYTIRVGKKELTYLNIPALAVPLALIGNYNDYMNLNRYGKEELDERMAAAFAASVASTTTLVKDMSFIQGTQELLSTMYEIATTEEDKVSKSAKAFYDKYLGFAARPLPQNNNLILQIEKFFDPTSYSRKEISDITAYSLGIQHIFGHPSVDILGDAIKNYPAETTIPYTHWMNINQANDNWKFMVRYNAIQGKVKNIPTKIYNKETDKYELRTMDAKEFYDYTVLSGKKFAEKLDFYRKNVNADVRVKESEEINEKTVTGVEYDVNRLHWEAKEEAKARLFLVKNVSESELNALSEMDKANKLQSKATKDEKDIARIAVQESMKITDSERSLAIAVKEVPKNTDELTIDYIKENAPNSKTEQYDLLIRLAEMQVISVDAAKKIYKVLELN